MVYVIIPLRLPEGGDSALGAKIKSLKAPFYDKHAPHVYFVSCKKTTEELTEALGYGEDDAIGSGIVVPITNYSGYANKNLWEWLALHDET